MVGTSTFESEAIFNEVHDIWITENKIYIIRIQIVFNTYSVRVCRNPVITKTAHRNLSFIKVKPTSMNPFL